MFWKTVLPEKPIADDLLGYFRYNGLKKMKAGSCLKPAVDAWQSHLRHAVPDPANVYKADYIEHAHWAKALYEWNPNTYSLLLAQWRRKHNRRRSLWRDMKAAGLSI